MSETRIKKIPYGISDYEKMVLGHYYYVDKTMYLETVENAGDYLFFIRPRRFGKSLFLSVMDAYYDVLREDQFDVLYKDTYIYRHPTAEKNSYLMLNFNFSAVDPHPKH
ncbi:MAG: AAA family ATPase, partial [bacterium]|nr:AAA family ATPase [bacterium]